MLENKVNIHGKKAAGVTVELMLAIALAVVVLFFVLSIFSNNLKTMVANSDMHRMWDKSEKSTYSNFNRDYSNSTVGGSSSQVNVQVLAEQGLSTLPDFINAAKTNADSYNNNPPQTQAQVEDLAKCLTILKMTGGASAIKQYDGLISKYGISINMSNSFYVTQVQTNNITGLAINEQFAYNSDSYFLSNSQDNQLAVAQEIQKAKYSPQ